MSLAALAWQQAKEWRVLIDACPCCSRRYFYGGQVSTHWGA